MTGGCCLPGWGRLGKSPGQEEPRRILTWPCENFSSDLHSGFA